MIWTSRFAPRQIAEYLRLTIGPPQRCTCGQNGQFWRCVTSHLAINGRPGSWRFSEQNYRPLRRLLAALAARALAVAGFGWQPATVAVITGALTWLALTYCRELAARH